VETTELRPLSLGELLDRTFTLYREHFGIFVGIMAIPAALFVPVNYFISQAYVKSFTDPTRLASAPPAAVMGIFWRFMGVMAVVALVSMILYSIVAAAVTFAVSEAYLGRKSTVATAYKNALGKVWRLLAVALNVLIRVLGISIAVSFVLGGAGAILIVGLTAAIPGAAAAQPAAVAVMALLIIAVYAAVIGVMVYLALRYAVAIPALMLEDLGVLASIRRSVQLTKGRRGQVFVALLLAAVISAVGSIVFYVPFYIATMISIARAHSIPPWLSLTGTISSAIGHSLTGPIFLIVLVLCYYDTRIRKEAFDLQFMMASLDRSAPTTGTVPSA